MKTDGVTLGCRSGLPAAIPVSSNKMKMLLQLMISNSFCSTMVAGSSVAELEFIIEHETLWNVHSQK